MNYYNQVQKEKTPLWFTLAAIVLSVLVVIGALVVFTAISGRMSRSGHTDYWLYYDAKDGQGRELYADVLRDQAQGYEVNDDICATAYYWHNSFMAKALAGSEEAEEFQEKADYYADKMGDLSYVKAYMDEDLQTNR